MIKRILLFGCACAIAGILSAQKTYVHCGVLLDMAGDTVLPRYAVTVKVDGNLIEEVAQGYIVPPKGVALIDLSKAVVMPGLIDCHVHIEWEQSKNSYYEKYTLNPEDIAFRSALYAKRTLEAGFTTVRDLGGKGVNIALRNAIQAGWALGPRIYTSGGIISITGGHGDHTTGARDDLFDPPPSAYDGIADGPDACRTAVRAQVKKGADWIKVTATGGVISLARDGKLPHYAEDELQTIVQTARDLGVPVAAHAHGDEGIRRAVKAGVTTIEHGTFMSDSTIELLKRYQTWYVPTLTAGWAVTDSARLSKGFFPEVVRVKALGIGPRIESTLSKVYQAGAPIAFGTDAGVYPHGKNALEFYFMQKAGMPNDAILLSATARAARMLGLNAQLGSIEKGKWADMVAVRENPLEQIRTMEQVVFVMKNGVVYKQ